MGDIRDGNLGPISSSKILLHSIIKDIDNINISLTNYYLDKDVNSKLITGYIDHISLLLNELKQNINNK